MDKKKALKNKYKQTARPAGVFCIRNTANNKIFLGSSKDVSRVWNSHLFQLKNGNHPKTELQNDWNEYGENSFAFEVTDTVKDPEAPGINLDLELKTMLNLYREDATSKGTAVY